MSTLFDPIQVGIIQARNRIVMAPLTRNRAGAHQVPTPLMALYYEQRSSAGLVVSEAAQIAPEAQGYRDTPGIYSPEQIHGWRAVTAAVHAKGGSIVAQLWHVGRISHVSLQPHGQAPVSSTGAAPMRRPSRSKGSRMSRRLAHCDSTSSRGSSSSSAKLRVMRWTRDSTGSRFMAPTDICSSSFFGTASTTAPIPMAVRWTIGSGFRWRS